MANNLNSQNQPQTQTPLPFNPVAPPQPTPLPQRLATLVGDWVRSLVTVVTWAVVAFTALAAGYLAVRAVLFVIELAHRALGI